MNFGTLDSPVTESPLTFTPWSGYDPPRANSGVQRGFHLDSIETAELPCAFLVARVM